MLRLLIRLALRLTLTSTLLLALALLAGRAIPGGLALPLTIGAGGALDVFLIDVQRGLLVRLTHSLTWDGYPALSPDGTRLAFVSVVEGEWGLFMMELYAGRRITRLTGDPAFASDPAWSPDGRRLLFVTERSNRDLFLLELPDGPLRRLTDTLGPDFNPAWSPDGRVIAYVSGQNNDPADIYLVDAGGGSPRRITAHLGYDLLPAWSPDGQWLAFVSDRGGQPDIFVIPTACLEPLARCRDNARQVTQGGVMGAFGGLPDRLIWTPDSQMIVFALWDRFTPEVYGARLDCAVRVTVCPPRRLTNLNQTFIFWPF